MYPTWTQQTRVIAYLGYDPFIDPALGRPKGNETIDVASLSLKGPISAGQQIIRYRLKQKKILKQFAEEIRSRRQNVVGLGNRPASPEFGFFCQFVDAKQGLLTE